MSRPSSYSQNDNQNYFSGDSGRTSSKVLRPPGGGSTISLSWGTDGGQDAPKREPRRNVPDQNDNGYGSQQINGYQQQQQQVRAPMQDTYNQYNQEPLQQGKPPQGRKPVPNRSENTWYNDQGPAQQQSNAYSQNGNTNGVAGGESFSRRNMAKKNTEVTGKIGESPMKQNTNQNQYSQQYQESQYAPQQSYNPNNQARRESPMGYEQQGNQQQQQQGRGGMPQHDKHHNHLGIAVGSQAFANGSNQNCGNIITDRSSTRIHAPPGGYSSITFG